MITYWVRLNGFMKKHSALRKDGVWLIAILMFVALHGTILYYVRSHIALSAVLIAVLAILVVLKLVIVKYRGLPHLIHALLRRLPRH